VGLCGSDPHKPTTQTLTWVAYQARTPDDGNHLPKHVGVKIWNVLIKIHCFLEHLLVLLQTILQDSRFNHHADFNVISEN
jgi:hypothetical protein